MKPGPALAALLLSAMLALGGCATTAPGAGPATAQQTDPWEAWNRKVFAFNEALDDAVLRPVATGYRDAVPALVRRGIGNFFGNLGDIWSAANHLLQGKVASGLEMGMRVLSNTFIGLGGVLDPATEMGMTRRAEDFGQTLGHWGLANGPYVVLPLFGPSTLRDTAGFIVDRSAAPTSRISDDGTLFATSALELVHGRAVLLSTTSLLGQIALDKYSFTRDAYLARRRDQLFDGAPPMEFFDDFANDPAPPPK